MNAAQMRATAMSVVAAISLCLPNEQAIASTLFQAPATERVLKMEPSCARCTIAIDSIGSIGDDDGAGSLERRPSSALQTATGDILITQSPPSGLAYLFTSSGKFVRRIGRKGNGPGEYLAASTLIRGPRDSITIIDVLNSRATVISSVGTFSRSYRLPIRTVLAAPLSNGQLVLSGGGLSGEARRRPFHAIDAKGALIRSFGPIAATEAGFGSSVGRRVAPSRNGAFWSAPGDKYRLERWNAIDSRVQVLTRQVEWFQKVPSESSGDRGIIPTPTIIALYEDKAGLLWVLIRVASRTWRDALGPPITERGIGVWYPKRREDRLFDTVIEVIDPTRAVVLASRRVAGSTSLILNEGLFARYIEDDDGIPRLVLQSVLLRRP